MESCSLTRGSLVAQMVKRLSTMWETWVRSLGRENLLEKEMAIHSSAIASKSHGQRSLIGYSPWGRKESDTTEQLHSLTHNQGLDPGPLHWGCRIIATGPPGKSHLFFPFAWKLEGSFSSISQIHVPITGHLVFLANVQSEVESASPS